MSSTRGQANQALYLARVLLAAWRQGLEEQSVPGTILTRAYLPAVRSHLTNAYGWFLLEITRPGGMPATPPRSTQELPEMAQGKALSGEVREFQRLEQDGWIGDMLSDEIRSAPSVRSVGNLASAISETGPEQVGQWADSLQSLFDRMGDSLDEY